jgi:hypothetical protein
MFQTAALELGLECPVDMDGQGFALLGQLVHQGRVVRFDELIEQCLLRLMVLVGSFAKAMPMPMNPGQALPALCQHSGPALDLHDAE